MNPKALIPLVAGLGIAGFAAKLGFDHLSRARGSTQTVNLWTVVQDVPRGSVVTDQFLKPLPYPAEIAPPGALTDKEKIVGRVPHTGVPANVPVLESMLLPPGTPPGVHVPEGLRAVAVKIDESSGVDNHLVPGCSVDVVGLFNVKKNNKAETIAKTIIEKVEVAAVGAQLAPEAPSPAEAKDGKQSRPAKPARAVTLLVRPEQVPVLHLAEQRGRIKLSMRGVSDSPDGDALAQRVITEDELLGLTDPAAEQEAPAAATNQKLADRVSNWFEQMMNPQAQVAAAEAEEEEEEAPEIAMVEPQRPTYTWVMTIYNGDERRTLGWRPEQPRQPVLLSNEGPNVFEDEQGEPATPRRTKRVPKGEPQTPEGYEPPTIPIPHQQPPSRPTGESNEPNAPPPAPTKGGGLFD